MHLLLSSSSFFFISLCHLKLRKFKTGNEFFWFVRLSSLQRRIFMPRSNWRANAQMFWSARFSHFSIISSKCCCGWKLRLLRCYVIMTAFLSRKSGVIHQDFHLSLPFYSKSCTWTSTDFFEGILQWGVCVKFERQMINDKVIRAKLLLSRFARLQECCWSPFFTHWTVLKIYSLCFSGVMD